jgi:membrane protein DedA with SNARE-associated domain
MTLAELLDQVSAALSAGTLPDLGAWSYVILVLLVFIEGPAATLVAATMASAGLLRADLVFAVSVVANFLADTFWYLVGYSAGHGGRVLQFGWLRRRWHLVESMESALQGRAAKMYLLTKLSMGLLTIPVLIASGVARVPWLRLLAVSVLVEPIWNGLLVLAGYRLGDSVAHMERGMRIAAIVGSVVIFVVLLVLYRRMFSRLFQMIKAEPPD